MKTLFVSYNLWNLVENGMNEYDVERLTVAPRNDMKENRKKRCEGPILHPTSFG